jgi:hypothetical protein
MHFAIYSMLFLEDRPKIDAVSSNSQLTMTVVIRNMQLTSLIAKHRGRLDSIHLFSHAKRRLLFESLQCLMQDKPSKFNFRKFWFCVLIHPFSRNHPDDNSNSPVSFDDMLEIFNQFGIYIGKKDFKKYFWTTGSFLRSRKPNYIKWQQACIKHCTPCVTPEYDDVLVEGVIEKWDPRLKASQIKAIKISQMFGADVVQLDKEVNAVHPSTTVVKSQETAESLRAVVGMDIKLMVGCDQAWVFPDDDEGPAAACPAAAGPPMASLQPAAVVDDAPPTPAPPVDPGAFTK